MDQVTRNKLRAVVIRCRALLEGAVRDELQGRFGIYAPGNRKSLVVEEAARMGHLDEEERNTRSAVAAHLQVLQSEGESPGTALDQFVREAAFTWLNRLVALKMMEARNLLRETVTRLEDSNGFKMWLTEPGNEGPLADYEKGDLPKDGRGLGPRQRAYRSFLWARCETLSRELRVLFDPRSLPGYFLPQPRILRELMDLVNTPDLAQAWRPGNEETIGWVYQGFNAEELEQAFREVRVSKKKFEKEDIPTVTQLFTPRWIVRFLVENTLGRLWIEMHPDSSLGASLPYLAPIEHDERPGDPNRKVKSVKEILFLDPACGTMHFGLTAFDLLVEMYREEMDNAGSPGWPEKPSVSREKDIPEAIIANNLHGIDIDLRAVQLSALTLYLKAKTLNPKAELSESRLACANIHMLDGENLKQFVERAQLGPVYRRILTDLQARLKDSEQLGSLLRLDEEIRTLVEKERERFERDGREQFLPGWGARQFEDEAGRQEFWEMLEIQIGQALDEFVRHQSGIDTEQTFFAEETIKGLRLLELMGRRYDVVVTNPPYMSARKMNATLKSLLGGMYPFGKGDLYAAFVQRCVELAGSTGRVGMLTMHSFMFISSYEKLRFLVREQAILEVLAHAGPALFDVGNPGTLQTCAYVFRREADPASRRNAVGTYFRLVKEPDSEAKQRRFQQAVSNLRAGKDDPIVYRYRQGDFDAIPGSPWVYWITPGLRRVFEVLPKLGQTAVPRVGLQTSDNFRFLRYWWEAGLDGIGFGCNSREECESRPEKWYPYMKGGSYQRWYGNQEYIINYGLNGYEIKAWADPLYGNSGWSRIIKSTDYYFRRGVTYSYLTSGSFSARISPGGFIFDVAGSSLFPEDNSLVLAILNSSLAFYALRLINPTVNFQVGDLARLPVPRVSGDALRPLVNQAIVLAKADSEEDETTWDFIAPPQWPVGPAEVDERRTKLAEIERQIDEEVYRLYGITHEDRLAIESELALGSESSSDEEPDEPREKDGPEEPESFESSWSPSRLAKAWISYAVGLVMGQFHPGTEKGLGRGRFDASTAANLRRLTDEDGLLVTDPAHSDDLAAKVLSVLETMLGEDSALELLGEALGNGGEPLARLRDYLGDKFFKEHIQKYRKRPIYWYLRTAKGNWGLWLFFHRLDKDLLFKALLNYVEPNIRLEEERLKALRQAKEAAGTSGREAKRLEKETDRQEQLLSELHDFSAKLRNVANLHLDFDVNDGVILNMAPLWELIPWNEPKKYRRELEEGKYDWSRIAYRLWPERVEQACGKNRSFAIAHGREDLYEE